MRTIALCTALLTAPLSTLYGQSCAGIPAESRGILAYGLVGTDGATGDVLAFAYRGSRGSVMLSRSSLSAFTYSNRLNTWTAQLAVPTRLSSTCVVSGVEVTRYDTEQITGISWSAGNPGQVTKTGPVGGDYQMVSVPLLLQTGKVIQLFDVGVYPFVLAGPVFQSERYSPRDDAPRSRAQIVPRAGVGVTLTAKWLVLRSTLTNRSARGYTLAGRHNFASIQLQAGVRY